MGLRFSGMVVGLVALMGLFNNVNAEDPAEILQRRVGTWITETTSRKAEWTPEKTKTTGEETIRWTLDKSVLVSEGWSRPGDHKSTGLMVYDQQTKQYCSWWFDNRGVIPRSDTTGQWDAQSESLNLHSDLGNRNTQTLKLVFTDKDRFDWTMIIRNQDGRTMMDMVGHTTRVAVLGTWEIVGFYGAANDGGTFVRTVKKASVKVGDRVLVSGTGLYDGNWRVLQAFRYKDPMDPQPLWGYRIEPKWQGVPPGFTHEGGVPARNEAKLQPLPPAEASKPM